MRNGEDVVICEDTGEEFCKFINRMEGKKMMYLGNEIKLTEDGSYRPEHLIINGEMASMAEYAKFHDGKNWKSTASGNVMFYRTESGKEYQIPQGKLRG